MSRNLYDIGPLVPLVEDGFVLSPPITASPGGSSLNGIPYAPPVGATVWEPAPVQPLESWLQKQWDNAVATGLVRPSLQISAQALELWQVIAQEEQASDRYHLLPRRRQPKSRARPARHCAGRSIRAQGRAPGLQPRRGLRHLPALAGPVRATPAGVGAGDRAGWYCPAAGLCGQLVAAGKSGADRVR